ncbi:hypothetical protein Leryth_021700 [Lithospermum erythrorhizon]|nr:hypothetical protein Leryth_021700 [Lithospermum erythrorhizon]
MTGSYAITSPQYKGLEIYLSCNFFCWSSEVHHLISSLSVSTILPYDMLMRELDVTNVRELEDFLINECMYVIKWADCMSQLDKKHRKEVEERVEERKKTLSFKVC